MDDPMYALQDVPGKGKGLVAVRKIPKGTRILSEEAVVTVSESEDNERLRTSICRQVEALTQSQKAAFLSMHNIYPYKNAAEQYLGIIRTNSLPAADFRDEGAIFLEACRINHACDNNAQKNWNENIKRHTVHAMKDIEKSEEITIAYLAPTRNRVGRQKVLQERFHFTCLCRLCSLPLNQSQENDSILEKINRLEDAFLKSYTDGTWLKSPQRALSYLDQQTRLYIDQGREDVQLAGTINNAAGLVIPLGDLARGRIFAEQAASLWTTLLGDDSRQAIKYRALAQDPSTDEMFGMSTIWKSRVDELPQGHAPSDFEDWLWRRDKPSVKTLQTNLRTNPMFLGFNDLPGKWTADSNFYESSAMNTHRPRRHWCFLGEILTTSTLPHLKIGTKDINGQTIPLHFYTAGLGSELKPAQIPKGHTVAVLYAKRRIFPSSAPGIRHEDPKMLKIFPLPLNKLLALNDQVQQFSTELCGSRKCHGCGKEATSLQRCAKCSSFWYCNRACQTAGWNEKGHKASCKLLKDPDLRGLLLLKWDKFDDYFQFSFQAAGGL